MLQHSKGSRGATSTLQQNIWWTSPLLVWKSSLISKTATQVASNFTSRQAHNRSNKTKLILICPPESLMIEEFLLRLKFRSRASSNPDNDAVDLHLEASFFIVECGVLTIALPISAEGARSKCLDNRYAVGRSGGFLNLPSLCMALLLATQLVNRRFKLEHVFPYANYIITTKTIV